MKRPFQVGDKAMFINGSTEYEVLGVFEDSVWIKSLNPGSKQCPHTRRAEALRHVPKKRKVWIAMVAPHNGGPNRPQVLPTTFRDPPVGQRFDFGPGGQFGWTVVGRATEVECEEEWES